MHLCDTAQVCANKWPTKANVKNKKTSRRGNLRESVSDKRVPKVIGVLVLLLSVYLFVAFVSYLFSWKADQDQVFDFSWGLFFDETLSVENWLGRFGAITSNVFFYWSVGISSFIAIFVLAKLGFLLLVGKSLRAMWSPIQYALTFVLYFSPLLAFVFRGHSIFLGGSIWQFSLGMVNSVCGCYRNCSTFCVFGDCLFVVWNFHHITDKSTFSFKWPSMSFSLKGLFRDSDKVMEDLDAPINVEEVVDEGSSSKKSAFIDELDQINKNALEFDLPKTKTKVKTIHCCQARCHPGRS